MNRKLNIIYAALNRRRERRNNMKLKKLASLALAGALTLGLLPALSSPALAADGDISTYTITIPSTLTVASSGWNATDGISATGTLAEGKKLTVTAISANSWALKQQDGSETVGYTMKEASDGAAKTTWEFTTLPGSATLGIDVADYSTKPAGTYTDTVTFTAAIKEEETCVTEGTLITLADGTQAPIETIKVGDLVQTWSFWNGRYEAQPVTVVINHGVDEYTVHSLVFSDGTVVETINEHGFYSPDLNDYAFISPENVDEYIGRHFVLQSKDGGNEIVTLAESKTEIRRVGSYSLLTAYNYNFMAENMLTITMEYRPGCFHFFDIGDDMAYDSKKMAQDIERYGLYTADEFSEYVTPEQFDMLNGPYYKVLVGRGTLNDSDITKMIEAYLPEKSE